jgi:ATP-binding cassette subfamily B protein
MKTSITYKTLSFYLRTIWCYPRYVIGLMVVIPLTALVSNMLPPLILANVLSRLAAHDYTPHDVWGSFGPNLVAYAVLVLFGSVVMWRIIDYMVWKLEGATLRDIANTVFKHLMNQSSDFHANHFGGSLVSQTNKLMGAYIRLADTTWFQVLPMLWSIIFVAIILSKRAPLYVVVLIAFCVIYISSAFYFSNRMRKLGAHHANAESKQTGFLADAITNVMAIKSFARNDYEQERYREASNYTHSWLMRLLRASQLQMGYYSSMTSTIMAISLVVAVISVVTYDANIATVFLILSYTASIATQLFAFSVQSLRNYNRSFGDAADMITILGVEPAVQDPLSPEKAHINHGSISFKAVTFKHDGSDEAIFDKLNLDITHGEKIGLVGHSGSGKTTFTRLLLRFSDIDSGSIEIDGQNIAHITQDDLHRNIAYVPQEPLLFHRSILENIAYGKPEASKRTIELAAQRAHATEFIKDLPKRYETLVGERGVKLSGGQRQRIAIARAMLKNAPILVLDEATSALDSESEVLIQDALWKLMEGRTAIVIAHRLSTVQHMDRIIVLDQGRIVEQGSHQELLHANGQYAKLWNHQSGGFIED